MDSMQFDVVVGNPPYNKGMDIDFVNLGFDLCTRYCVMITPAKWQTAEADQRIVSQMTYGEFREKLVPHMSRVVFYPDCVDVFSIQQKDGISYYCLDKNKKHDIKVIENRCRMVEAFNGVTERSISNREPLNNIGNEIVEYLGDYKRWTFGPVDSKRYQVWTNHQISFGSQWGYNKPEGQRTFMTTNEGNCYVIGLTRILDTEKGETPPSKASKCFLALTI